jgi:DNA adenine methylase
MYVEPFGGAGSVLLRKPRSFCEVYNDIDDEVVNLFRVLRDREFCLRLCDLLELTPFSRREFENARGLDADPIERARRLVVRSFQAFGTSAANRKYKTGFRAASKQSGRPHARDWANLPECLWLVTERLRGVVIENRDGLEIIRQQDHAEALFYIDPPYLHNTRNENGKNYRFEFTMQDHLALAKIVHRATGRVILSGYESPLYADLYKNWRRDEKAVFASGRSGSVVRKEILWMNF